MKKITRYLSFLLAGYVMIWGANTRGQSATVQSAAAAPLAVKETSMEARFQLDTHVADDVLATFLPTGFTSSVATQGPAKDCNLRVVFIDRMTINGPEGKPVGTGSNRLVYLVAPVKDVSGANAQLVIGGLTEDSGDAPGPFGDYLQATTHTMQRTIASGSGAETESQDWVFAAASGERLEMHIEFEESSGMRGNPTDTKFYSAKTPTFYQISHQEQVLDILRNTTTNPPDRVKDFSFKAGGGSYSKLFDGKEKLLSWDHIIWMNRAISLP